MLKSGDINSFYLLTLSLKGSRPEKAKRFFKEQLRKIMKQSKVLMMMLVFLFSKKLTTTRYLLVEIEDDVVGDLAEHTGYPTGILV